MTKSELFNKIEMQGQLPTLPTVVIKILNLIKKANVSANQICKVISTDMSLSSKVLKIVNSAFYGFPKKISTINQAVVILGFNSIKSSVLGISVISAFNKVKKDLIFDYDQFWLHSIAVGASARIIAQKSNYGDIEEAFIGGLIHDIGKLILSLYNPKEYNLILEKVNEKNPTNDLSNLEREAFGYDHTEIGHYLLEKWNFPENLCSSTKYHHKPNKIDGKEYKHINTIVNVANILVTIMDIGNDGSYFIERISRESWNMLKLDINNLENLYDEIEEEYQKSHLFISD